MILFKNLEQLLLKNWASFFDLKPFTAYILSLVRDGDFEKIITDADYDKGGFQLKLSQFRLTDDGFLVWVEFVVPKPPETIVGTSELLISFTGEIEHRQTVGKSIRKS